MKTIIELVKVLTPECQHHRTGFPITLPDLGPCVRCLDCGAYREYNLSGMTSEGPWTKERPSQSPAALRQLHQLNLAEQRKKRWGKQGPIEAQREPAL